MHWLTQCDHFKLPYSCKNRFSYSLNQNTNAHRNLGWPTLEEEIVVFMAPSAAAAWQILCWVPVTNQSETSKPRVPEVSPCDKITLVVEEFAAGEEEEETEWSRREQAKRKGRSLARGRELDKLVLVLWVRVNPNRAPLSNNGRTVTKPVIESLSLSLPAIIHTRRRHYKLHSKNLITTPSSTPKTTHHHSWWHWELQEFQKKRT